MLGRQVARMPLVKMTYVSFNPIEIRRLGAYALMKHTNPVPHLIKQTG